MARDAFATLGFVFRYRFLSPSRLRAGLRRGIVAAIELMGTTVMDDTAFDALAAAQTLREAGFGDRQAEAVAETVRDGREGLATKADRDTLATKADIAALETKIAALETKIAAQRAETREKFAEQSAETREKFAALETKIAELRTDAAERGARHIQWTVGGMIALSVLFAAIVKFL